MSSAAGPLFPLLPQMMIMFILQQVHTHVYTNETECATLKLYIYQKIYEKKN